MQSFTECSSQNVPSQSESQMPKPTYASPHKPSEASPSTNQVPSVEISPSNERSTGTDALTPAQAIPTEAPSEAPTSPNKLAPTPNVSPDPKSNLTLKSAPILT